MKISLEKPAKKLKLNVFNIKSFLIFNRKKLEKVKKEKKKFGILQLRKKKVEQKESKIESSPNTQSVLKSIGQSLLSKPKSIIDKFKEFFGVILLGILVNNLPRIITELQKVLGKIKEFFDNNPWIGKVLKFTFDVIAKGMKGILDLTKTLMPVIGGSFKFALDTIKTAKNEIGRLIKFVDDLGGGISALMTSFGANKPQPKPQPKPNPASRAPRPMSQQPFAPGGKPAIRPVPYGPGGSSTGSGRGQFNYKQVLKQQAQRAQAAQAPGYEPNTGTTKLGSKKTGYTPQILAPLGGVMGAMEPGKPNTWGKLGSSPALNPSIQRYQAVNQANKVQKLSIGGTIRNFFSGMFGGSRRGLGNIPPQEGTGRGSPSDTKLTTKDSGKIYASPYASPAGTAKGRKARETVNYFKIFERTTDEKNNNLIKEEKNLSLFSEFMKSYGKLSDLRLKYGDQSYYDPSLRIPPGTQPSSDEAIAVDPDEVVGILGSTGRSTGPHIHIENASSKGGAIPENVKRNIFVNGRDMITALYGPEDGNNGIGYFEWRKSPRNPTGFHAGEDFGGVGGEKITLRGGLKFVKYIPDDGGGYGNRILIEAPDGSQYTLSHLQSGPTNQKELIRRQQEQLKRQTPGGSNAEKVWNYFKSKKIDGIPMTDIAVAGIMGNAQQESGFNPTIAHSVRGNGGKFIGIFQWGNKGDGDRWGNLKKWAKQNGNLNVESIDTQLKFAWTELGGSYKHVLPKLQAARTPEEAAQIWYDDYEVASHGLPQRQKYAKDFYKQYKGKGGKAPAPVLSKTQQLEKNIISAMGGKPSITVGDKTVSVEKKDGKDVIRVTTGGLFGIGAKQLQLNENLLNNLLYEIRSKNQKVQPVKKQGGPDAGSGINNNASITIIDKTTVAIVPEIIEKPVFVETPVFIPVAVSGNFSSEREIVS